MKKTSKLLSLLLALILLCSVFPVSASEIKDVSALEEYSIDADTSAVTEFKISSAESLRALSAASKSSNMNGVTFYLASDIELAGSFSPISDVSALADAFAGTFDGNGYSITGLSVSSSSTNGIGLFGWVNGGTVRNLRVEGNIVSSLNDNKKGSQFVGGIIGKTQGAVTVTNCSFSGSITTSQSGSNAAAGGIIGRVNSGSPVISSCANFASITAANGIAGGILGYTTNKITIENCYNSGNINAFWNASGIVANITGSKASSSVIENCYSIGEISVSQAGNPCAGISANCNASAVSCYSLYPETDTLGSNKNGAGTKITSPEGLSEKLGSAFIDDTNIINSGYPIFPWQEGKKAEPETPSVKILGAASIHMTNSGSQPSLTLTASLTGLDSQTEVIWSIENGADLAALTQSDNNAVITPIAPGCITVKAETAGGEYSDIADIFILPHINLIKIDGTVAAGETVRAVIYTYPDGAEYDDSLFPPVTYSWKRLSKENYDNGNTGFNSYEIISGAAGKTFTIPEDFAGDYLAFDIYYDGHEMRYGSPEKILSNDERIARLDASSIAIDDQTPVKEEKTFSFAKAGDNGSIIGWKSSDESVISSETGKVTLPESGGIRTVTLTAKAEYNGAFAYRYFNITVYSAEEIAKEKADKLRPVTDALSKLKLSVLTPVYGEDENIVTMFKESLSSVTEENIAVSLKSAETVYDGGAVAQDGRITFFYKDPADSPLIHHASVNATFTLSVNGESTDFTVPVIIPWDEARVKAEMEEKITSKIVIPDADVTEDIPLSKVIGDNKWALISWTSTNTKSVSISSKNQGTADTLFEPYIGIVRRGANDEAVTLTAKCTFGFSDKEISVFKTFDINVKALDKAAADKISKSLSDKMDSGFKKAGLTDAVTGEKLTESDGKYTIMNDVLFPTTRDFKLDGKFYPVTINSTDPDVIFTYDTANAARAAVYRPAPGESAKEASVTVTITDKDANISVSRTFDFIVLPITDEEIASELALMEKVKASYFDGIKGNNSEPGYISYNLIPFVEVYEKDGGLVWVKNVNAMTNSGIVPTPLDGWEELEAYRLFKSSNPSSIAHETLKVSVKANPKAVTVEASLSSETLGRYGELYLSDSEKYAAYAPLLPLYAQHVSVDLIVRGRTSKKGAMLTPVSETVSASFSMQGPDGTLIEKTNCADLKEGTTAFDVFKSVLEENKFTYEAKGSYVSSITTPDGEKISELDYGQYSGWLYKVNGKLPDVVMSAYGLSDGDEILFYYTKDYNRDYKPSSSKAENTKKSDNASDTKENSKTENPNEDNAKTEGTYNKPAFKDVHNGSWFYEAVSYMCENGIMKGMSEDEFAPDETLTRAMFVTLLYRLEKEPAAEGNAFSDIKDGAWFENAVSWAYKNGIVSGTSDTKFSPEGTLSRQDAAAMLYRYAKLKGYDVSVGENTNILSYEDYDKISEYAIPALSFTAGSGIMTGRTEKTINPEGNATRAEAAAILMRFINFFNK